MDMKMSYQQKRNYAGHSRWTDPQSVAQRCFNEKERGSQSYPSFRTEVDERGVPQVRNRMEMVERENTFGRRYNPLSRQHVSCVQNEYPTDYNHHDGYPARYSRDEDERRRKFMHVRTTQQYARNNDSRNSSYGFQGEPHSKRNSSPRMPQPMLSMPTHHTEHQRSQQFVHWKNQAKFQHISVNRTLSKKNPDPHASNDEKGRVSDERPKICYKPDFLYNCGISWLEMKSNKYINETFGLKAHNESFLVSNREPVVTFSTGLQSNTIPHFHITDPLYRNPHQMGRQILPTRLPSEISKLQDCFNFSVLSYNILSDDLLWQHKYLYTKCQDWILQWQYRKANLLREIVTYNADIICLQEVQVDHYNNWFLPELKMRGYDGIFKQRSGEKTDGCAVFFRERRFICTGCRTIEYNLQDCSIMDRDNIGMVVALHPKEADTKSDKPTIFIANTHLLFNKNRGDIKLLQLALLFAEVDELAKSHVHLPGKATKEDSYNPIILCGDLNSTPFSPLYHFIIKGNLKYEGTSRKHISGQMSPNKFQASPQPGSTIQNRLIPKSMEVSYLCQKKITEDIEDKDYAEKSDKNMVVESSGEESEDCFVVGEKVDGKCIVLEEPGVLKHLLQLKSVYKHALINGKAPVTSSQGTVDYIFFSHGKRQTVAQNVGDSEDIFINVPRGQLYLTGVLSLLTENYLSTMQTLPNVFLSSDHLALLATFRLFK